MPCRRNWPGSMAEPRSGHAAVLLDDGTVLVVGGGTRQTAELYDPATQTFTHLGDVPFEVSVPAIRLVDGTVLVVSWSGAPHR